MLLWENYKKQRRKYKKPMNNKVVKKNLTKLILRINIYLCVFLIIFCWQSFFMTIFLPLILAPLIFTILLCFLSFKLLFTRFKKAVFILPWFLSLLAFFVLSLFICDFETNKPCGFFAVTFGQPTTGWSLIQRLIPLLFESFVPLLIWGYIVVTILYFYFKKLKKESSEQPLAALKSSSELTKLKR